MKRKEFLEKCHNFSSETFYNGKISEEIKNGNWDGIVLEDLWRDYLYEKFSYYIKLNELPKFSNSDYKKQLDESAPPESYLSNFIEDWYNNRDKEKIAYLYRYTQLPPDILHDFWYDQSIAQVQEWCNKCREELESQDKTTNPVMHIVDQYKTGKLKDPFTDIYTDWNISKSGKKVLGEMEDEINNLTLKYSNSGDISSLSSEFQDMLYGIKKGMKSCLTGYGGLSLAPPDNNFFAKLSIKLIQTLYDSQFDEDELIKTFLNNIKENFKCEVCDYVDVKDDGKRIEWRLATVDSSELSDDFKGKPSEEVKQLIIINESYQKGEGISGNILLRTKESDYDIWQHIGSNNVSEDPRKSLRLKKNFEKDMYHNILTDGIIYNFMMFPIFRDGQLIGAFRVANRLDSKGKLQLGGWPYFDRVELSIIAIWFSRFIQQCHPLLVSRDDFNTFMAWGRAIEKVINDLQLQWIENRENFNQIVRRFYHIVSKKEEKRNIGCTVIIAKKQKSGIVADGFFPYPFLDLKRDSIKPPYIEISGLADVTNPQNGAFVFDENGNFQRVATLDYKKNSVRTRGYDSLKEFTGSNPESVCITLPIGVSHMLFFKGGIRCAELYLSQRSANWQYRYLSDIKNELEMSYWFTWNNGLEEKKKRILSYLKNRGIEWVDKAEFKMLDEKTFCISKEEGKTAEIIINCDEKVTLKIKGKKSFELKVKREKGILKIFKRSLKNQKVIEIIIDTCLECSHRKHGALIVLGELSTVAFDFKPSRKIFEKTNTHYVDIKKIDISTIVEFAKLDGAIVIDDTGQLRMVNTIIRGKIENNIKVKYFHDRGSRHQSAEIISNMAPDALIFVVSENGGISVLEAGEIRIKDY